MSHPFTWPSLPSSQSVRLALQAQPASRGGWPWSPPPLAVPDFYPSQADLSLSLVKMSEFQSFWEILTKTPSINLDHRGHSRVLEQAPTQLSVYDLFVINDFLEIKIYRQGLLFKLVLHLSQSW